MTDNELAAARTYFTEVFRKQASEPVPENPTSDQANREHAGQNAGKFKIVEQISDFAKQFNLNTG